MEANRNTEGKKRRQTCLLVAKTEELGLHLDACACVIRSVLLHRGSLCAGWGGQIMSMCDGLGDSGRGENALSASHIA